MNKTESLRWMIAVLSMSVIYVWNTQVAVALAFILISALGLPHGAADTLRMWGRWPDWKQFAAVMMVYALVTAISAVLFYLFPLLGLLIFIAISVWHFGRQDAPDFPSWSALGVGGLFIFGPFLLWSMQLVELFQWLRISPSSIDMLIASGRYAFFASIACCLLLVALYPSLRRKVLFILMLSIPVAVWMPPLLSFALYFSLLHAPRHARVLHAEWPNWWRHPLMLGALFISWVLIAVWLLRGSAISLDQRVAEVMIIGMAAVTVPHMLLDFYLSSRTVAIKVLS